MCDWQPIETAPKDGSLILGCYRYPPPWHEPWSRWRAPQAVYWAVRYAAFQAQQSRFILSDRRISAYEYLADALCIAGETAIKLCRACGCDPVSGERLEEE